MTDAKIDLYKLHKAEYAAKAHPTLVETTSAKYLAIEGSGEPGGDVFQARTGALYSMAYTLKFTSKAGGTDYAVSKLEGRWWSDTPGGDLGEVRPENWRWQLLIRTPDAIDDAALDEAHSALEKRGKATPETAQVELVTLDEGRCAQILHVGPYDTEKETIQKLRTFMADEGLSPAGTHHEVYLNDPRRIDPSKLKTIIRQPVE